MKQIHIVKRYFFTCLLLTAMFLGGGVGYLFPEVAPYLKPLGDIYLNLIFTMIVPLVFFTVSAAVTRVESTQKIAKILCYMFIVFIVTGMIAAIYMLFVVYFFPPALNIHLQLPSLAPVTPISFSEQFVTLFTVNHFAKLFSHENMLALIVFALLIGIAVASLQEKASTFAAFLQSGASVSMQAFAFIMYYAPIGFFAYFAVLVSKLGPELLGTYVRVAAIYYTFASLYFICVYSAYAFFRGRLAGVRIFWQNAFLPMMTALATCSSAASIPANLMACQNMRLPKSIYETVIPLGTILHKDGSILAGVLKIAFLFGLFHLNFSGIPIFVVAVLVALLVGTVMGAIPSGGMLGEILILSIYGFPPTALIAVAAISMLIDPLATMLNVIGNIVASFLVTNLLEPTYVDQPIH